MLYAGALGTTIRKHTSILWKPQIAIRQKMRSVLNLSMNTFGTGHGVIEDFKIVLLNYVL